VIWTSGQETARNCRAIDVGLGTGLKKPGLNVLATDASFGCHF
jgi:hypothetical protein